MVRVTRKVEFSAAHFYHNPNLSAEENRRIFGKCNNPKGHGHNYVLEVTVAGEPDPETGMVLDLKELKDILEKEVMERMDHRHLNYEVPELAGKIPTCENIAAVIWTLLDPKITQGKLDRVRLYESPDLFADCTAEQPVQPASPQVSRQAGQSDAELASQEAKRRAWRDR
jgi:6-pyruvoyltetrahydropterin/6-carboxytetrahydropterin synthase